MTLKTELLPHQQRVVDRISNEKQRGLVVVHGLGSGKTLTSIAAQDALGMPATVVVPASLQDNFEKERSKHLEGEKQPISMTTLQMAARRSAIPDNPMLVVDEAHRLRETTNKGSKAVAASNAEKRLLLTGTPFYNRPNDISPLINIAANEHVLPTDERAFNAKFIKEQLVSPGFWQKLRGMKPGLVPMLNPKGVPELKDIFSRFVDHYPGSTTDFPEVTREDIRVPMAKEQLKLYDALEGSAPYHIRAKVRAGLPPSKQETEDLNAFLNAVRQVTNTTAALQPGQAESAPKIDLAFSNLKKTLDENERAKAVVYSNFLGSGIEPYKKRLTDAGISFGEFTGEMTKRDRDQLVRDYNENRIRTLLLSSAGGEGLDLKGTRLMQVLEPHWNVEKIRQVEGRGARFKSHSDLPEGERTMKIERYLAQRPRSGLMEKLRLAKPGLSADEYLALRSDEKDKLIQQFKALLPKHEEKTMKKAASEEPAPQASPLIRRRFDKLTQDLRTHGAYVGTGHRRILIPKNKLTETDLGGLGFVPVTIAIPETGQDRFKSFRHPDNLFHLHSHPEGWTMHEDEHHSSTMLMKKEKSTGGKAKAFVQGIPHVSDEGLPGLYYYAKGLVTGGESTAQRVMKEVPVHVQKRINRWVDSPTYTPEPKVAFQTSQFSGDLGPGPSLPYASGIPPFRATQLRGTAKPSLTEEMQATALKTAMVNGLLDELTKLNGMALSPATRLAAAQKVGGPRITNKTGPSIADISKPPGMGTALPGATKSL